MRTMICADTNGPRMCAPLARNENENETKLSNHGGQNPTSPPNLVKNIISYMNCYIYTPTSNPEGSHSCRIRRQFFVLGLVLKSAAFQQSCWLQVYNQRPGSIKRTLIRTLKVTPNNAVLGRRLTPQRSENDFPNPKCCMLGGGDVEGHCKSLRLCFWTSWKPQLWKQIIFNVTKSVLRHLKNLKMPKMWRWAG